ncbi:MULTISPECIES: helix-turn-helix transcriptional regulator [Paenibacillus]|uniref:helix-turn-helix transcriptional regulator n=1 Tax=Paenibacillus TaxID=44249 RepID=UPI0022B8B1B7|nr:helix-turn-helix transcriptional regulator [Paenibacillus caseinilyticus]MCZ8519469.1 helix-turn-helix transcriptional regulator [Paenibacillus caseinilyticus]
MFILFEPEAEPTSKRTWSYLSDIPPQQLADWKRTVALSQITESMLRVRLRLDSGELQYRRNQHNRLIEEMKKELSGAGSFLSKLHLYVLFDTKGYLLQMVGSSPILNKLAAHRVPGVSMALESAGLNALSVSMQLGRTSVMEGHENTCRIFGNFTAICSPVQVKGQLTGYMGLAIQRQDDIEMAVALLQKVTANMEDKLNQDSSSSWTREEIYAKLDEYGLTPREKEVAYRWMHHETTVQISCELYITEGTVRNMIKTVYRKTGINEKGRFITKFLL